MIKEAEVNGEIIQYELTYKRVKNINLRIKSDGSICVSASKGVPQKIIDEFVVSKYEFIKQAVKRIKERTEKEKIQYFEQEELKEAILELCKRVYPYFESRRIEFPQIKFKKMVSMWGSCYPQRGILTFNLNLMYAPIECIEYVVLHEFTHFICADHSKRFYSELERVCPNWKECREKLKEINIR